MVTTVHWTNFLWVPRSALAVPPPVFAPGWEYQIELLKTPEGRLQQQQIAVLRNQAEASGLDPDEVIKGLTNTDHLLVKNWSAVGESWWVLCAGDEAKVRALCRQHQWTIKDKRPQVPWPEELAGLAMVMKPKPNQPGPFERWMKAGHGIFKAAPAFGKTYIMIWSTLVERQRTLLLTHTDALAEQFITRFRHGSPKTDGEGFTPVTNCLEIEKQTGTKIIGRYRSPDELWPVTVATWQSFISPGGRKALKQLREAFGVVLCDEAHVFAAPSPASVVNGFSARKRGVTATPKRKDQLDVALYDVVGPVTAEGKVDQLPVQAHLISTGVAYKGRSYPGKGDWARILNFLYKSDARTALILKWLLHDAAEGRKILVLGDRRSWILDLADTLKKEHGIKAKAVVGGIQGTRRDAILQEMASGELQILCATSKIAKEGLDIPVLDTLFATMPMANSSGLQQLLGRARRPHPAKTPPVWLRYFVDEGHGQIYGCAKATHKHLLQEGVDIFLVPEGRDPAKVMGSNEEVPIDGVLDTLPQKKGLKAAASRAPSAVSKLFTDFKEEARQTKRYHDRMRTT